MVVTLLALGLFTALVNGLIYAVCARGIGRTRVAWRTIARTWLLLLLVGVVLAFLALLGSRPVFVAVGFLVQIASIFLLTRKELRLSTGRAVRVVVGFVLVAGLLDAGIQGVVRAQLVQAFRVPTASMQPTFEPGDFVLVWKRGEARRGDCVAYAPPRHPDATYLHRIVGMPGDVVEYAQKKLVQNGREVHEPWAHLADGDRHVPARDDFGPLEVPDGTVFLMGDNRDRSSDSRYFGPVDMEAIIGRAWLIYAPVRRWGVVPRVD